MADFESPKTKASPRIKTILKESSSPKAATVQFKSNKKKSDDIDP